jgi:hypothetical protein
VLRESVNILVQTGHSPKALAAAFRDICSAIPEPSLAFDPRSIPYVEGLPHVVAHWYADPSYVDRNGKPIALRLHARGRCLAILTRRVFPNRDPAEVAESLVNNRAVEKRAGLYLPKDRYVFFGHDAASAKTHVLASLVGLLRTVQHNLCCADESLSLLARAATNPYIPVRALPSVHRRIKREMGVLLFKIDSYLRRCEVKPGSEPTTCVGVGGYAFEDPMVTGAPAAAKMPPRRSRSGGAPRQGSGRSS